jgi:hypothetical protein
MAEREEAREHARNSYSFMIVEELMGAGHHGSYGRKQGKRIAEPFQNLELV